MSAKSIESAVHGTVVQHNFSVWIIAYLSSGAYLLKLSTKSTETWNLYFDVLIKRKFELQKEKQEV